MGGVLGFLVIYTLMAFTVTWNDPDARLERALNKIIVENDFVSDSNLTLHYDDIRGGETTNVYIAPSISHEDEERILAQLKEACNSCIVDVRSSDVFKVNGTEQIKLTTDVQRWTPKEDMEILEIQIAFRDKGLYRVDDEYVSSLSVHRRLRDSDRWSFFKRIWPW